MEGLNAKNLGAVGAFFIGLSLLAGAAVADETCMSPYMAKIVGQEDFVYIWTVGIEGVGDGSDKLVTVDVNPGSPGYGTVVHSGPAGYRAIRFLSLTCIPIRRNPVCIKRSLTSSSKAVAS
jgi:hypothetical protein